MPKLHEELHHQLLTLYNDQVGDSRWHRITDAIVKASYLNSVQVLLPGTGVRVENQAVNSDSPLTDSMNSNQQEHTVGAAMNTESGEVESSSSMSFIEARTLFQTTGNNGSSSSGANTSNSNDNMSVHNAEPN